MKVTPAQQKQMAQEAMAARQKEELARPRSGKPGPFMPVMGDMPELSPAEKAANKKELDAKIKANQPAVKPKPVPAPRVPAARKFDIQPAKRAPVPMEQVEIDKAKQIAAMPQSKMPQANITPQAQMAAMQKMPQPGTVPQAAASPMMTPTTAGPTASPTAPAMKRGGKVRDKSSQKFSSGGSTSKASSRGDGIAQRGKTKGRYI